MDVDGEDHTLVDGSNGKPSLTTFSWGDRKSLGHTCVVCKTRCNNPRAKQSCFGIHCEPCAKYHQIMHAVGCAHHCKACRHEETAHYERHKEITELVMLIKKIDLFGRSDGPERVGLRLIGVENEQEETVDEDQETVYDDTSTDISSTAPTPSRSPAALKRLEKKALKEAKELAKAQKHQNKFNIGSTPNDISVVARAIHGSTAEMQLAIHTPTQSLDTIIDRNIRFVAALHGAKKLYSSDNVEVNHHNIKKPKESSMKTRIQDILTNLGLLSTTISHNNNNGPLSPISPNIPIRKAPLPLLDADHRKRRQNALTKVQTLIQEDIEKSESDQRQTLVRMAGYWRYVNRGVYNKMLVNREHWEWVTGARVEVVDDSLNDAAADDDANQWDNDLVEDADNDEDEAPEGAEDFEDAAEYLLLAEEDNTEDDDAAAAVAVEAKDPPTIDVEANNTRFILAPENETAYHRITMQNLEALALAVVERDERRAVITPATTATTSNVTTPDDDGGGVAATPAAGIAERFLGRRFTWKALGPPA